MLGRWRARSISSEYSHYQEGGEVLGECESETEDQMPNRQRECERAEAEVLPLIQVFLNDEKRS